MKEFAILSAFMLIMKLSFPQTLDTVSQKEHSPRMAMILSSVIPGSGQAYNRQYWKIPVLYAGLGGLVYSISYNNKYYLEFRNAYLVRHDNDTTTTDPYMYEYTDDNLIVLKDQFKRYRDLSIIGTGLVYILNVVDAYVFAQMYRFNVSQDLSMHIVPDLQFSMNLNHQLQSSFGITLVIGN